MKFQKTLVSLAILAASPFCYSEGVITNDTYFYGESPPVYPSPQASGLGAWSKAYSKAKALVQQLTIEEKVNLTTGYTAANGCSGNIQSIPHIKFPGLCLSDAGNGLRSTDLVSSYASGLHVGASWNADLAYKRALSMAGEFKRKGVNMLLGPVVGPIGRVVEGGRNWEGFSTDPYISGILVGKTVSGIQKAGVMSCTKHFITNEQETFRNPVGNVSAVSSNVDDATLHELYLWPFQDAIHAGSASVMCSYQRINNSYGCQNSKLLNGVLKEELGFQGLVVSDWDALHGGYDAALAGLDMAMPDGGEFWGANLTKAAQNGSLSETRLNDMATRIISSWYYTGQDQGFPEPGLGMPANVSQPHEKVEGRDPKSKPVIFDGAVEGHVLVKNLNNTLPLKKPVSLYLAGYSAKTPDVNSPSPDSSTLTYQWTLGCEASVEALRALFSSFTGNLTVEATPAIAKGGTILSGGGSGATAQSAFLAPYDALVQRAVSDDTQLFWDFSSPEPSPLNSMDACLVFINSWASEAYDRPGLRDDYSDGMVLSVANKCSNTIVIIHNAGIRLVDQWIDHPNVTAVVYAHLPGQDTGKALVSLLYGESQFSGKLPYTVARNESDYGEVLKPSQPTGEYELFPQSDFDEGVYIDYRKFDRDNITPRFEFGFGLSYTTFSYSSLKIQTVSSANTGDYPRGSIVEGGQEDLWDVLARVSATVTNTGKTDGAEVAQLYVGSPDGPVRQLRGFQKPLIQASRKATVAFELTRRDLSVWDVQKQAWKLSKGPHKIYVGSSSRKLPLNGELQLK